MLSNLRDEVKQASQKRGTVIGFNVFGYEDAKAVIDAAEKVQRPTALMINKLAIEHMPIESWAGLLRPLAESSKVPVSIHLDHCKNFETVIRAIHEGFTSVMFDGSQHPLSENIRMTKEIVKVASCFDVTVEGEIGSVPYADIPGAAKDLNTSPEEAKKFAEESGVDWMAVAVGQVHRLTGSKSNINFQQLKQIEDCTNIPIVIHGGSGIKNEDLNKLINGKVGKINFGTQLRIALGEQLQESIEDNPDQYDRLVLFEKSQEAVTNEAEKIMNMLKGE